MIPEPVERCKKGLAYMDCIELDYLPCEEIKATIIGVWPDYIYTCHVSIKYGYFGIQDS